MKYLALPFLVFFVSNNVKAQDPEDFLGKFKGSEDIEFVCKINDDEAVTTNETRTWEADYTEVNKNILKGEVLSDEERYSIEGSIAGNAATGIFERKDKDGNICNGEFIEILTYDELNISILGSCPSVKCTFKSKITATRQNEPVPTVMEMNKTEMNETEMNETVPE